MPTPRDKMLAWFRELFPPGSDQEAAMAAGVPFDFKHEQTADGLKITATSQYPVAVVRDSRGVTVYSKRPS